MFDLRLNVALVALAWLGGIPAGAQGPGDSPCAIPGVVIDVALDGGLASQFTFLRPSQQQVAIEVPQESRSQEFTGHLLAKLNDGQTVWIDLWTYAKDGVGTIRIPYTVPVDEATPEQIAQAVEARPGYYTLIWKNVVGGDPLMQIKIVECEPPGGWGGTNPNTGAGNPGRPGTRDNPEGGRGGDARPGSNQPGGRGGDGYPGSGAKGGDGGNGDGSGAGGAGGNGGAGGGNGGNGGNGGKGSGNGNGGGGGRGGDGGTGSGGSNGGNGGNGGRGGNADGNGNGNGGNGGNGGTGGCPGGSGGNGGGRGNGGQGGHNGSPGSNGSGC
jgi:hypothetical protein